MFVKTEVAAELCSASASIPVDFLKRPHPESNREARKGLVLKTSALPLCDRGFAFIVLSQGRGLGKPLILRRDPNSKERLIRMNLGSPYYAIEALLFCVS